MVVLLFAFYFCLVAYRSALNFFRGDYYGCIIGRRHAGVVSSISMFGPRNRLEFFDDVEGDVIPGMTYGYC